MKKIKQNDKLAIGLFFGLIFGSAINNVALGLCLGLLFGSFDKLKA